MVENQTQTLHQVPKKAPDTTQAPIVEVPEKTLDTTQAPIVEELKKYKSPFKNSTYHHSHYPTRQQPSRWQ